MANATRVVHVRLHSPSLSRDGTSRGVFSAPGFLRVRLSLARVLDVSTAVVPRCLNSEKREMGGAYMMERKRNTRMNVADKEENT